MVVTIPAWNGPTGGVPDGIVFNPTTDFELATGKKAIFIFSTEDGTISGWNPGVDPTNAVIKVNNWPVAVYKGLALASAGGANYLYAANFRAGTVAPFPLKFTDIGVALSWVRVLLGRRLRDYVHISLTDCSQFDDTRPF